MAVTPRQNPEALVAGDLALKTKILETIEAVFAAQAGEVIEARKEPFYFHPDVTRPLLQAVSAQLPFATLLKHFAALAEAFPDDTAEPYRVNALKGLSSENHRLLTLVCNNKITPTTQQERSKAIQIVQLPGQIPPESPVAKLEVGQRFYSVADLAGAIGVRISTVYSALRNASISASPFTPHCQGVFFQYVSVLEEGAQ